MDTDNPAFSFTLSSFFIYRNKLNLLHIFQPLIVTEWLYFSPRRNPSRTNLDRTLRDWQLLDGSVASKNKKVITFKIIKLSHLGSIETCFFCHQLCCFNRPINLLVDIKLRQKKTECGRHALTKLKRTRIHTHVVVKVTVTNYH